VQLGVVIVEDDNPRRFNARFFGKDGRGCPSLALEPLCYLCTDFLQLGVVIGTPLLPCVRAINLTHNLFRPPNR
jgi:hypothetical protein